MPQSTLTLTREETNRAYQKALERAREQGEEAFYGTIAELDRRDLFFLLTYTLRRQDANTDFVFERCREVQNHFHKYLDLWAREHYKSTIKTFALPIQRLILDPEGTQGIFSHTRPIAKQFLRAIKIEAETNYVLRRAHQDVFWMDPKNESPKWSENEGLIFKRRGNPKEATFEAWGLVDGQPTSKHFTYLWYDDVVSREAVTSTEMIEKTTRAWGQSLNLGKTKGGYRSYTGTRWHFADTYKVILERQGATLRLYTPTVDGTLEGETVLWTRAQLAEKLREYGPYDAAAQLFQNPLLEGAMGFKREWLRYWAGRRWQRMNRYLLCDPAGEKKKDNDFTVFMVVGVGADRNYYVIKMIRDRMSLTERGSTLFRLHQEYQPIAVGYEKYGKDSDIEHYEDMMERREYRFTITPLGGTLAKPDRIRRLVPLFESGRLFLPESMPYTNYLNDTRDLVVDFVNEEYLEFPFSEHDDMLDCLARIRDEKLEVTYPMGDERDPLGMRAETEQEGYDYMRGGLR